jgi:hypothetical protein
LTKELYMNRKCYGESEESYPGLKISSNIEGSTACAVTINGARQVLSVTNYSLLTYDVTYSSFCDKDFLFYVPDGTPPYSPGLTVSSTWDGAFSVPFRWKGDPRTTPDAALLVARAEKGAAEDREITINVECKSAAYAPIGPFRIALKVDTER